MLQVTKDYNPDDTRDPYNANEFIVGDIIEATYSYSARIPQFFKITRRTASTIFCQKLKKKSVTDDGYGQNGACVPIENEYDENKIYSGRINKKSGHVRIDDCLAHLWNHKPSQYYSD